MRTAEELIDKHIGIVSPRMLEAIQDAMKAYAKEACEDQIKNCCSVLPYPHRQLSYNSLYRLIEQSPIPDLK